MTRTEWTRRWVNPDVLLAVVAVCAGVAAALSVRALLQAQRVAAEQEAAGRHALREVIVASRDLPAGEVLSAGDLAVRAMPGEYLPPDVRPAADAASVIGRALAVPALRGDAVTARSLRAPLPPAASQRLQLGDRAVTISVDETNAVAGLVGPGDRVDLLYLPPDAGGQARVMPLVERVPVLAAGPDIEPGSNAEAPPATLTLRVAAEDAVRIALAQRAGRLTVLLRSRDDESSLPAAVRSSSALLPQPLQRPSERGRTRGIEFLVGGGGQPLLARAALATGPAVAP